MGPLKQRFCGGSGCGFSKEPPGRRRQDKRSILMSNNSSRQEGRILKVKKGYNPNSSSIGSDILAFLAFAGGAGVFSVILANTMDSIKKILNKNKDKLKTS